MLIGFTCPCGHYFTGNESAGSQATNQKGTTAMDKIKRDLQLLDDATPGEKVIRFLHCDLTLDEVRERGERLVKALSDRDELLDKIKRVTQELKAQVLEIDTKANSLRQAVGTRREYREVQCTEMRDFKKSQVYVVRDDLGSITETRPMSPKERQRALPGVPVEKAKDADAKQPVVGHAFQIRDDNSELCKSCGFPKRDAAHSTKNRGVALDENSKPKAGQASRSASASA